jgi:hypothetical protein
MTEFRSRPRAICANLTSTLLDEYLIGPDKAKKGYKQQLIHRFRMSRRGAVILQAVADARLPIAIITELPEFPRKKALRALPSSPDIVIYPKQSDVRNESVSVYDQVIVGLGIPAADILYVGNI